jgi:peptidoglycan/LPS O-acetylase OafA/YrhL
LAGVTPAAPARLAWIEAFRGFAASAVVLYHVARHFDANYGMPRWRAAFQFGHAGVDLFFVISGFVILFVHWEDIGRPQRISRYAGRRLTRILPIYWVALALTVASRAASLHIISHADIAWAILPLPIFADPLLGVAWTLQYELVFYVVFGLMILTRAGGVAVLAGWLGLVLIAAVRGSEIALPDAYWQTYNLEFFAGMVVAYWLHTARPAHGNAVLAAGVSLFLVSALAEDAGWIDGYGRLARLAYGVPSALIVCGGAAASRRGTGRVPAVLAAIGAASYSIYLFQFIAIGMAWQLWRAAGLDKTVPPPIGMAIFCVAAIGAGVAISRLVEYPLLTLFRGLGTALRPVQHR